MNRPTLRFFATKLVQPIDNYSPKILSSHLNIPLNDALKEYQSKLIQQIETIKAEVDAFPPDKKSPPIDKIKQIQDTKRAIKEKEWQQVMSLYEEKLEALPFKRRVIEPKNEEQLALAQKARELSMARALAYKKVYLETIQNEKCFIQKDDWVEAIEFALDNPVSYNAEPEEVIQKRNTIFSKLNERISDELLRIGEEREIV